MDADREFARFLTRAWNSGAVGYEDGSSCNFMYPVSAVLEKGKLMVRAKEAHEAHWSQEITVSQALERYGPKFRLEFQKRQSEYADIEMAEAGLAALELLHEEHEDFGSW